MPTKTLPKSKTVKTAAKPAKVTATPDIDRIAQVPDRSYFDRYVSRRVLDGSMSEFEVFDYAHGHRHNVLIEGPTGPGKTSAVLAWAAKHGKPFFAIPSNIGIEPSQLFGKFIPDGNGSFKWQDGPVTDIVRHGGVLLINEVNFMPERVSTVLFGLLDTRREISLMDNDAEVIRAHDDLLVIADMNPNYEGTRNLNKALRNRFAIQLEWDYAPSVEGKLIKSGSLLDFARKIRQQVQKGEIDTPVSTNMLLEFESIAKDTSVDFAMENFINHFVNSDERATIRGLRDVVIDNIREDFLSKEERNRIEAERRKAAEDARAAAQAANDDGDDDDFDWFTETN